MLRPRRTIPIVVVGLAIAGGIGAGVLFLDNPTNAIPVADSPNVLLIVLDTTRADILSCYGSEYHTTPRIDDLASYGVLYRRAYSTNFWTLPSHATILTGLYPGEAGATSETNHLPTENETLAERLHSVGYRTAAVVANAWVSEERGFSQGFDDFFEAWREMPPPDISLPASAGYPAFEHASDWIAGHASDPGPFFLFVNFNIAHLPYKPPPAERCRFWSKPWREERVQKAMSIKSEWSVATGKAELDDRTYRLMRELYASEVSIADGWIGQLIDQLAQCGKLDNTLVIVTADHGEHLGEHDLLGHPPSMYECVLRVPLIIRYPKLFQPGKIVEDLVSLTAITPTILDACGLHDDVGLTKPGTLSLAADEFDGPPFVIAENGRPINALHLTATRFPDFDADSIDYRMRSIREGRHKLVWKVGVGTELYDLRRDPGERNDLSDQLPEVRDDLLNQLRDLYGGNHTDQPLFRSQDEETRARLRALGYID